MHLPVGRAGRAMPGKKCLFAILPSRSLADPAVLQPSWSTGLLILMLTAPSMFASLPAVGCPRLWIKPDPPATGGKPPKPSLHCPAQLWLGHTQLQVWLFETWSLPNQHQLRARRITSFLRGCLWRHRKEKLFASEWKILSAAGKAAVIMHHHCMPLQTNYSSGSQRWATATANPQETLS